MSMVYPEIHTKGGAKDGSIGPITTNCFATHRTAGIEKGLNPKLQKPTESAIPIYIWQITHQEREEPNKEEKKKLQSNLSLYPNKQKQLHKMSENEITMNSCREKNKKQKTKKKI